MNGSASLRGYLVQTMICLLDTLDEKHQWSAVTLEPDIDSTKVDVLWYYPNRVMCTQVKSSHRQFNKADVVEHANALQASIVADEYELILLGPCSQAVVELGNVGKVRIPVPRNLDLQGLIEQAAHKLDKFYEARDFDFVTAEERELLAHHLVSRLEAYSTFSFRITRPFFEELLREAVSRMYSQRKDKVDVLEYYRLRINRNYDEMAEHYHVSSTRLQDAIMSLSARHRVVLEFRNGLRGEGEKLSNERVALEFGITAERIREIDRQAKVTLKRRLAQQEKKGACNSTLALT